MSSAAMRDQIRSILDGSLPRQGLVLEIASGTGEDAVHMARSFPFVAWQPTEIDSVALASIEAAREAAGLQNLLRPIAMDVTSTPWPIAKADAIVAIDFTHSVPWESTEALFERAAHTLAPGAALHLFGPIRFFGKYTTRAVADQDLKMQARDPKLGMRDISALIRLASRTGFGMPEPAALPPDAHALTFKRDSMPPPTGKFVIG